MFGITDLPTYLLGTILIILLPGPNSFYVMTVASRLGHQAGYRAAYGVLTGDTILMLLTVIGAASILRSSPAVFIGLKMVGALYLSWLAIQLLRQAYQRWYSRHTTSHTVIQPIRPDHPFKRALSISLLNPKAILFFVSFFIQFVDPEYHYPVLSFLILGVILQILSLSYMASLILAGTKLARFFQHHVMISTLGICTVGCVFLGFAVKLIFSTL